MSCIAASRASQPETSRPKWPKVVPEEDAFHFISLLPDGTPLLPANEAETSCKESEWLAQSESAAQWMGSLPEKDAHSLARCGSNLNQKIGRNSMASSLVASPRSPGKIDLYKELLATPTKPGSSPRKQNSPKNKGKAKALFQSSNQGTTASDKPQSSPTSKKLDPQMKMFLDQVRQDQTMAPSLPSHVPLPGEIAPGSPLRQQLDQMQQWNTAGTPGLYAPHTLGGTTWQHPTLGSNSLHQMSPFYQSPSGFTREHERGYAQGVFKGVGPWDGTNHEGNLGGMSFNLDGAGSLNSSVLLPVPPQFPYNQPTAQQQLQQYGLKAEMDGGKLAAFAAANDSNRPATNSLLTGLRSWNEQQQLEQAKMRAWNSPVRSPNAAYQNPNTTIPTLPSFPPTPAYPYGNNHPAPATPTVTTPMSLSFMLDPPASQAPPGSPASHPYPPHTTGLTNGWPPAPGSNCVRDGSNPYSQPGSLQYPPGQSQNVPPAGQQGAYMSQQDPQFGQQAPQFGQQGPLFGQHDSQSGQHSPQFGQHSPQYGQQSPQYGQQDPRFGHQDPQFGDQDSQFGQHDPHFGQQGLQFGQEGAQFGQQGPHFGPQFGLAAEVQGMQQLDPAAAGMGQVAEGAQVTAAGGQMLKVAGVPGEEETKKKKKWFGWCSMCRKSETSSPKHNDSKGATPPVELTPERVAELEPHVVKLQRMRRKSSAKKKKLTAHTAAPPADGTNVPPAMLLTHSSASTGIGTPAAVNGAMSAAANALAAATSAANSPTPNGPSVYHSSRLAPQSTTTWPQQYPDSPLSPQVSPMHSTMTSPPTSPPTTMMLHNSTPPGPNSPYMGPNSPYVGAASPQVPAPPVNRLGQSPAQPSALSPSSQIKMPLHLQQQQPQPSSLPAYTPPQSGTPTTPSPLGPPRSPRPLSPRNATSTQQNPPVSTPGSPSLYPQHIQPPSPMGPSPLTSGTTPPSPMSPASPNLPNPAIHHAYAPLYSSNSPRNNPSEHGGSGSTPTTTNSQFMSAYSGSQSNLSSVTGPGYYTPPDSPLTNSAQTNADRLQTYNNPLTPNSFTPNTDSSTHFTFNNPLSRNPGSNVSPLSSPAASPHAPVTIAGHLDSFNTAVPSPMESPAVLKHYNFFSTHNTIPLINGSPHSSIPSSPASSNLATVNANAAYNQAGNQGNVTGQHQAAAQGYMPGMGNQGNQMVQHQAAAQGYMPGMGNQGNQMAQHQAAAQGYMPGMGNQGNQMAQHQAAAQGYMPGMGGQHHAGSDVLMAPKGLPNIRTTQGGMQPPSGSHLSQAAGQRYDGMRPGPQPAAGGQAGQWSQNNVQGNGGLKLKKSSRRLGLETSF